MIPSLPASRINSGTFADARLPSNITRTAELESWALQSSAVEVELEKIPDLPASRITSGVFPVGRIPSAVTLDADLETWALQASTNQIELAKIPPLPASRITSGAFDDARIPTGIARDSELDGTADTVALTTSGNDLTVTVGRTVGADIAGTVTLPASGEDNVQSDWDVTDTASDAFIINKPSDLGSDGVVAGGVCTGNDLVLTRTEGLATVTISEACVGSGSGAGEDNVNADWAEADTSNDAFILNKPTTITATQSTKLAGIDTGAEVNVQVDWDVTSGDALILNKPSLAPSNAEQNVQANWTAGSGDAFIQNKPTTITTAQTTKLAGIDTGAEVNVQSDWSANSGDTLILNKPIVITGAERTKLAGIETGAEANVQPDWNADSGDAQILNKPALAPLTAEANVQADWAETNANSDAFVQNKPTIGTAAALDTGTSGGEIPVLGSAGTFLANVVPGLPASRITSGAFSDSRIPSGIARDSELDGTADTVTLSTSGNELTVLVGRTVGVDIAGSVELPTSGENNVQVDWDEADGADDAFILNKPTTITTAQNTKLSGIDTGAEVNVQSNWNTNSGDAAILFKPTVITMAERTKLAGIATAAEVNVQGDWDVADATSDAFILNKPADLGSDGVVASGVCTGNDLVLARTEGLATVTISQACVGSGSGAGEDNVQADFAETDANSDAFILNKPTTITMAQATKLSGIEASAEVNVQADWDVTSGDAQILNKPVLSPSNAEQNVQSNWNAANGDAFIQNKPTTITTAQSTKLAGVDTGAEVNAQSDWSANSGDALILNKPTVITGAERTKLTGIAAGAEVNVQSDWDATSGDAQILNKPSVAPSTAEENVQANWTETDTNDDAFVQNKPTLGTAATRDTGTASGDVPVLGSGGTLAAGRIPSLPASQIASGTFGAARIPSLPASRISSGTFADARIPSGIARDSELDGTASTVVLSAVGNELTVTVGRTVGVDISGSVTLAASGEDNVQVDWDEVDTTDDAFILNKPPTIAAAQTTKLAGIDTGAEVNVQSDWTSTSGDALILNKPTLAPSDAEENVQSDWNIASGDAFILNKPPTITVAQGTKLAGIDTGAEVNVESDWNANSGDALSLPSSLVLNGRSWQASQRVPKPTCSQIGTRVAVTL